MNAPSDHAVHKARVVEVFEPFAPTYDEGDRIQRFKYFGRRLVEAANLHEGANVLDVATGRGAVLFAAAERVEAAGHVTGIDLTPAMVKATDGEIRRRGVTNAEVRVMDAENLEFADNQFDAVSCGFGVMFLPDLARGLREFRRVLKPGGTLAVSTWGPPDPQWRWLLELQQRYGVQDRTVGQFIREPKELDGWLAGAGFEARQVVVEEAEFIYSDADDWWASLWSGSRIWVISLDAEGLARFKADAVQAFSAIERPEGTPQRQIALFGLATK